MSEIQTGIKALLSNFIKISDDFISMDTLDFSSITTGTLPVRSIQRTLRQLVQGDTREELIRMYPKVFEMVAEHGYNMTGRDHIIAYNTERGV